MPVDFPDLGWRFVHMPKTGGTWLSRYGNRVPGLPQHASAADSVCDATMVATRRDPAAWYESYWRHCMQGPKPGVPHNFEDAIGLWTEPGAAPLLIKAAPPGKTLYQAYCGHFFGRDGILIDAWLDTHLLNQQMRKDDSPYAQRRYPKRPTWRPDMIDRVDDADRAYYDHLRTLPTAAP